MRDSAHDLRSPGDRDACITQLDILRRAYDRLKAGRAQAIDGECRSLIPYAALNGDDAGKIHVCGTGLVHVAEDDMLDLTLSNTCTTHSLPND